MNMCPIDGFMELIEREGKKIKEDIYVFSLGDSCIFTDSSIIYRVQDFLLEVNEIPQITTGATIETFKDNFVAVKGFYMGIEYDSVVVINEDITGSVPLEYWNIMRRYYDYGEIQ